MKAILFLAFAAAVAGESLTLTPQSPWKTSSGAYSIEYDGSTYANIGATLPVEPESHYIVRWMMKSSVREMKPVFQASVDVGDFGNALRGFVVGDSWNEYAFCFFSGGVSSVPFKIYCNPSPAKTIEVKDVTIVKISAEQFFKNLMPDGNFMAAKDIPVLWRPSYGIPELPATIVPVSDFLAGEQCMQLKSANPEKGASIESIHIPMLPGKSFKLSFWAKCTADTVLAGGVNGWSMYKHTGGHWYKQESFKVTTSWNEFTLQFDIPADFAANPDLRSQMLLINFGQKKNDGAVYISGIKFRQIDKSK
ncbi:MAG: hypothetical protein HZC28_03955 [Spirochaetes bacterium]|nr:hypothetical protein [Spirochaetota bacterium]